MWLLPAAKGFKSVMVWAGLANDEMTDALLPPLTPRRRGREIKRFMSLEGTHPEPAHGQQSKRNPKSLQRWDARILMPACWSDGPDTPTS